jgi:pyridoxal phosphate enzyme (YggS family)
VSASPLDPEIEEQIGRGLDAVRTRIERAARAAGRDPADVSLLAVSKLQPAAKIRAAYARGQRDFGENYAQELVAKAAELGDLRDLRFHMIGHLQRNKVSALVGLVSAVHSVDSVRLAAELGKRAKERPVPPERRLTPNGELAVFIEVNVAGEASKSGCSPAELSDVIAAVRAQPALRLAGLMTIPAGAGELSAARTQFEMLGKLQHEHGGRSVLPGASIGMSRDLEVAIEHGSTWVRVGTDIFGARP